MQAESILRKSRNWRLTEDDIDLTIVDPSMKTGTQDDGHRLKSVLEIYLDNGVEHIALGNNSRVQGWGVFKDYLHIPEPDENGDAIPMLRISSKCVNTIETLPTLTTSLTNPEDVDTDGLDHIADAIRYLLMFIQVPFARKSENKEPEWLKKLRENAKENGGGTEIDAWTA